MHESRQHTPMVNIALATFIGTCIEWYDFFLYGTAAALVFGPLFFSPQLSPVVAQLSAFATFGVGFAARPVGGMFFGHFGDRLGRKTILILTLIIMGTATFFIGCLPLFFSSFCAWLRDLLWVESGGCSADGHHSVRVPMCLFHALIASRVLLPPDY